MLACSYVSEKHLDQAINTWNKTWMKVSKRDTSYRPQVFHVYPTYSEAKRYKLFQLHRLRDPPEWLRFRGEGVVETF